MEGRRGSAQGEVPRWRVPMAAASALLVLWGAQSCGPSSSDPRPDPLPLAVPEAPSWTTGPSDAIQREGVDHLHLDEVRRALAEGRTQRAGQLLAASLRELEEDMRPRATLDSTAAATFEAVRRTSDRWQAGVRSGQDEQRIVLRRLEEEARRLLGPK